MLMLFFGRLGFTPGGLFTSNKKHGDEPCFLCTIYFLLVRFGSSDHRWS